MQGEVYFFSYTSVFHFSYLKSQTLSRSTDCLLRRNFGSNVGSLVWKKTFKATKDENIRYQSFE